jgi:hypothetical protein
MTRQVFIPIWTGNRVWHVEPAWQPHAEHLRVICYTLKNRDTGRPLEQFVAPSLVVDVPAGARATDPDTAHQAAHAAHTGSRLNLNHRLVLSLLREHGALTDYGLSEMAARRGVTIKATSIGKRRHELATIGQVADTGRRAPTDTGRSAVLWQITTAGRQAMQL